MLQNRKKNISVTSIFQTVILKNTYRQHEQNKHVKKLRMPTLPHNLSHSGVLVCTLHWLEDEGQHQELPEEFPPGTRVC